MPETDSSNPIEDSRGVAFVRLAIAMIVLPSVAIVLRFWSRSIISSREKFWWDDWLALASWACSVFICICALVVVNLGAGKKPITLELLRNYKTLLLVWHTAAVVFEFGLAFTKLSALVFYLRAFEFSRRKLVFKLAYWTTFTTVLVFIVPRIFQQIFNCSPPSKAWNPTIAGRCISLNANFALLIAGMVWDVTTDLAILIFPIPAITKLQIPSKRKLGLVAAFICGYVTWATSITRAILYILAKPHIYKPDAEWYVIPALASSLAEIGIATISICVPTWLNFFARLKKGGITALFHSRELIAGIEDDRNDDPYDTQHDEEDE